MEQPEPWQCEMWQKVLSALEAAGKTSTSYYVRAREGVRLCERREHERVH